MRTTTHFRAGGAGRVAYLVVPETENAQGSVFTLKDYVVTAEDRQLCGYSLGYAIFTLRVEAVDCKQDAFVSKLIDTVMESLSAPAA